MTLGIEGIPFIIRFKTEKTVISGNVNRYCIEGIPFIIRFKTWLIPPTTPNDFIFLY